jgi:DNA ligase 1
MKKFAELYFAIDGSNKTNDKVAAVADYLRNAPPADAAWAVFFLRGSKLRAPVPSRVLAELAAESSGVPPWLFDECYEFVGDLAETAALLIAESPDDPTEESLDAFITKRLAPLRSMDKIEQRGFLLESWRLLSAKERLVWNKLITGSFRVGVSEGLVLKAIAAATGIANNVLAHRLAGAWLPSAEAWELLTKKDATDANPGQPYPFCLAHPLDVEPDSLGDINAWIIEYKWDGIRAQVIKRLGDVYIWSRGGERLSERFPEIVAQYSTLPDGTVIDGELLAWKNGTVLPFADLQHRITRKNPGKKLLETTPARIFAFDLLEWQGRDVRSLTLDERRQLLQALPLDFSPVLQPENWKAAAELQKGARQLLAEGLMLKRRDSRYGVGRERGVWWKWKVQPYSVDAVLVYAQRGHGRRASLFTDYTFAVWDNETLVPFAKAYSGLTDSEIREVDSFIRRNTLEKFGPVSTVKPELVFEIAFEGIQRSSRHKSGIAVRFPRMARWRTDKKAADADTIDTVKALLKEQIES